MFKLRNVFISIQKKEQTFLSKNSIGKVVKSSPLFIPLKVFLLLTFLTLVILGGKVGLSAVLKKLQSRADMVGISALENSQHFKTVLNFQSLNGFYPPPEGDPAPWDRAEIQFEASHLESVISSDHFTGLKHLQDEAEAGGANPEYAKQQLLAYTLLNSHECPLGSPNCNAAAEIQAMKDFCLASGPDPLYGINRPGNTEAEFENAFLHYSNTTIVNDASGQRTIPGYDTVTDKSLSRIVFNRNFGDFYSLNLDSPCVQTYKYYKMVDRIEQEGYDGIMIDEMIGGGGTWFMSNNGGQVREYGNRTCLSEYNCEINADYANSQAAALTLMKNASRNRYGREVLIMPNTAEYRSPTQTTIGQAAGGALTEFFSGSIMRDGIGEEGLWNYAKSILDNGGYFVWSEHFPDAYGETNPNNYTGAPGFKYQGGQVVTETSGIEARHDMLALSSYLMIKDKDHRAMFEQRAMSDAYRGVDDNAAWDIPLSAQWRKAQEMDIGEPIDDTFSLVKSGTNSAGQGARIFERAYEKGLVLFSTRSWYDGENLDVAFGSYTLPNHYLGNNNYRVLYPDGSLSANIVNTVSLCLQEGVVLIPDGYDPFAYQSGGSDPNDVKVSILPATSSHSTGESSFVLNAEVDPAGQQVCSVTMTINFPSNLLELTSEDVSDPSKQTLGGSWVIDSDTKKFLVGINNCTTAKQNILNLSFHGLAPGDASIQFTGARVVGGVDPDNSIDLPFQTVSASVTVTGGQIQIPQSFIQITNGATINARNYYTLSPIFEISALPPAGNTITELSYQIIKNSVAGEVVTVSNQSSINNILLSGDGTYSIIYWTKDSAGTEELPHNTAGPYLVDTSGPGNVIINTNKDTTYKDFFNLFGNASSDTEQVYINGEPLVGAEYIKPSWQKTVPIAIVRGTDNDGNPQAKPTQFTITAEDLAGNSSSQDTYITRLPMADVNGDFSVNVIDLAAVMGNWLNLVNYKADFNEDALCDELDFSTMMYHWGIVP